VKVLDQEALQALHALRAAEKEQAQHYRDLIVRAEAEGAADLAERLSGLHADEQHHLSRLTARLLELGEAVADPPARPRPPVALEQWDSVSRAREADEVSRYRALLARPLDGATAALAREILDVELQHEKMLGGKWMCA
jgi:hypothetical protein